MDHLSLLLLDVQKVFQSKDELQYLSEKRDTGKVRALPVAKKNGGSITSVYPVVISPENNNYMTTTKTEKNTKLSVTDNIVNACGTVSSHDRHPEVKPRSS